MFAHRTDWNLEPNRFSEALERQRASGAQLLDLTASNPTRCGFRYDESKILDALRSPAALDYAPDPRGLRSAREAVSGYYRDRGESVGAERIILTTSTSEAYSFLFRLLCDPGDEVLIPAPSYPLFELLASLQDVRLATYPLFYDHGWHIDLHALEQRIAPRTRAVLVVHPNNPTGSYVSDDEAAKLQALCAGHNLALIADEVFLDFSLGVRRRSFGWGGEALTFALSGLSKIAGLPQMKVAWIVISGPGKQVGEAFARLELIADTYLSMNAPLQHALPALLSTAAPFQQQLMMRVRENLTILDRELARVSAVTRLEVQGGWYTVLRVPVTRSDEDLAITLLENEHVIVHPGHFYDFRQDGYLVLSLITPAADFSSGISRVLAAISAAH
jgi:alanine-synthesizing transaminase